MYELTLSQFKKMLKNLSQLLDKGLAFADIKKFDSEVLLNSRLYPDQFNFIKQVQITCDTAKLGFSRLTGKDAPTHTDNEKTVIELKTRIESVVTYLNTFSKNDLQNLEAKRITTPRWEGKSLSGEEFLIQHLIPNFYFHLTTAYAILRNNGVEVGKKDYLGEMPYQKPF